MLLGFAACTKQYSPTVPVDPALALLVPSDTTWVAGARIEPLRNTPLFQRLTSMKGDPLHIEEFVKETGVDPRQDLWEFLAAGNGKDALLMARGKFTEMGMEPRIQKEGVTRRPYKGYNLMGDEKGAIVFMNSTTALAGPTAMLQHIIDTRGQSGGIPKALQDKISKIPRTYQIWFVHSAFDQIPMLKREEAGNMANLNNVIGRIKTLQGAFDLSNGVKMHMEGETATGDDARRANDTIRGLIGLARLNTPANQPELLQALDAIHVTMQNTHVLVDANFPIALVDELQKVLNAWAPESRRPDSSSRHLH